MQENVQWRRGTGNVKSFALKCADSEENASAPLLIKKPKKISLFGSQNLPLTLDTQGHGNSAYKIIQKQHYGTGQFRKLMNSSVLKMKNK